MIGKKTAGKTTTNRSPGQPTSDRKPTTNGGAVTWFRTLKAAQFFSDMEVNFQCAAWLFKHFDPVEYQ